MPCDIQSVTEIVMTNLVHKFFQAGVEASQQAIQGTSCAQSVDKAQEALLQKKAQEERIGPKKMSTTAAAMALVIFSGYGHRLPVKPTSATEM